MKFARILMLAAAALVAATGLQASAGVPITTVDRVEPTDEIFMDMAVTAAKTSIANKGKADGAVIILNGAWRSTGMPTDTDTPEENAIIKSRLDDLANATVYTVCEPTAAAINAIRAKGADAVYFVCPREQAIAAGVYTAADYDDSKIDSSLPEVPLRRMNYDDATELVK